MEEIKEEKGKKQPPSNVKVSKDSFFVFDKMGYNNQTSIIVTGK